MPGYIQVYTGDGKGKTTAAIGLAIRAVGAGKKVLILQFMKSLAYSEQKVLKNIPGITLETVGKPFFVAKKGTFSEEDLARIQDEVVIFEPGKPPADYVNLIHEGLQRAREAISSGEYDIVILDEYNMALYFELLTWEETERLLDARHEEVEVVFTGRGAPKALLDRADLVTDMVEVKHYYMQGIETRCGIEH